MHIHHLALRTHDLVRLESFYRDLVGLTPIDDPARRTPTSVWLLAGETRVMLERRLEEEPGVPAGSFELVAFAIEASGRVAFEEKLAAAGVAVEGRTAFTVYFRDPDGRRVAVSHFPEVA